MSLTELRKIWEQFQVSAVENQYNQWMTPNQIEPIANELIKAIEQYVEENNGPERKQTNT